MKASHLHLQISDLTGSLQWFEKVLDLRPQFQNPQMAAVPFGPLTLILDSSENDAPATIAFESENCDEDFRKLRARGAYVLQEPRDQPWGVRTAYFKGPGALSFEIEQARR